MLEELVELGEKRLEQLVSLLLGEVKSILCF
jgi:hypothetical protein